jgi:hypothetical protein
MALGIKSNFSIGNVIDPTQGAQRALSQVGSIMSIRQDAADKEANRKMKEQAMLQQQANSDRMYELRSAAEGRKVSEYDLLNKQRQAMSDAANIPTNITDGQIGQQVFEDKANVMANAYHGVDDYNTKLAAIQNNPSIDQNAAIDQLRASYNANTPNPELNTSMEAIGNRYRAVNEASGYDGLKANMMDPGYEARVTRELIANNVDPIKAAQQARLQTAAFEPKPQTKEQLAAQKAQLDIMKTQEKNDLDVLKNSYAQGKVSSARYSTKSSKGNSSIAGAVKDLGFQNSFLSFGDGKSSVNQLAKQIAIKNKGISESDVADALYMMTEGEANAWLSLDPRVSDGKSPTGMQLNPEQVLTSKAAEIAKSRLLGKESGIVGSSTYSKYGPKYAEEANRITNKYANARADMLASSQNPSRNDTGMNDLLAMFNKQEEKKDKPYVTPKTGSSTKEVIPKPPLSTKEKEVVIEDKKKTEEPKTTKELNTKIVKDADIAIAKGIKSNSKKEVEAAIAAIKHKEAAEAKLEQVDNSNKLRSLVNNGSQNGNMSQDNKDRWAIVGNYLANELKDPFGMSQVYDTTDSLLKNRKKSEIDILTEKLKSLNK